MLDYDMLDHEYRRVSKRLFCENNYKYLLIKQLSDCYEELATLQDNPGLHDIKIHRIDNVIKEKSRELVQSIDNEKLISKYSDKIKAILSNEFEGALPSQPLTVKGETYEEQLEILRKDKYKSSKELEYEKSLLNLQDKNRLVEFLSKIELYPISITHLYLACKQESSVDISADELFLANLYAMSSKHMGVLEEEDNFLKSQLAVACMMEPKEMVKVHKVGVNPITYLTINKKNYNGHNRADKLFDIGYLWNKAYNTMIYNTYEEDVLKSKISIEYRNANPDKFSGDREKIQAGKAIERKFLAEHKDLFDERTR